MSTLSTHAFTNRVSKFLYALSVSLLDNVACDPVPGILPSWIPDTVPVELDYI